MFALVAFLISSNENSKNHLYFSNISGNANTLLICGCDVALKFSLTVSVVDPPYVLKSATNSSANASTVKSAHAPPAKSYTTFTVKYSHFAYNLTSPWRPASIFSIASPSNSGLLYHPKKIAFSNTGSTNNTSCAIVYVSGPATSPHAPPLNS